MSITINATRPEQSSKAHCDLCNRLTRVMNEMLDEHSEAVVGSAVLTACAAFAGFVISRGGSREVSQVEIEFAAASFTARVREYLAEQAKQLCTAAH
jgi:hypothetical protein